MLIYVLSLSALSAIVLIGGVYIIGHEYTEDIIDRELTRTEFADRLFLREIQGMRRNILAISEMPPIQGIVRASDSSAGFDSVGFTGLSFWKERLERIFTAFITSRDMFFQLRLIGIADGGREIVRVERRGKKVIAVPDSVLQAKAERDYFQQTIQLGRGQIYLSRIDLNREWGKVEVPHRPTVRAATPIYSAEGKLFGILIANMDMTQPLKNLETGLGAGFTFQVQR